MQRHSNTNNHCTPTTHYMATSTQPQRVDLHGRVRQRRTTPLGAAVIHSLTNTTIYIDASGQKETHTIMRAELAAIFVALDIYKDDQWLGIFTDSQTGLHAIQNDIQRPSHTEYHHHKPLITAIVTLLQYWMNLNLPIVLRKLRGHSNIRGNDL